MFRIPSLTVVFALTAGTAALAQLPPQPPPPKLQLPGTDQEHDACRPDVMKFCRYLLPADVNVQPDVFAVANCLQAHQTKISAACSAVLTGHGQ
ncbi:MAG TPA: hypothetical protein VK430_07180 [Xanthobacteraceae bacterium]|nr:hypothetical protein [Xanthobacteraceae bacterium]